jgi:hypothetical protein
MRNKAARKPRLALVALAIVSAAGPLRGQQMHDPAAQTAPGIAELEKQLEAVSAKMDSMRQELIDSRTELQAMRAEMAELRREVGGSSAGETDTAVSALRASVEQLQETSSVLGAEVKQHDQTKVETVSKFPVRIDGAVLFTALSNSGNADNLDVPTVAMPPQPGSPQGSLSAAARQTILGLEATGPHWGQATSSAALSVDFFGSSPYSNTTTAAGLIRLRTAHATLAWPNRALTVAFDRPILSPNQPTSWITVSEPALAWSGNLWSWAPQLEFSQNLPRGWGAELALIDPPGEPHASGSSGIRTPDAAESSRQPGYEAHLRNTLVAGGRQFQWGAGGYYSRHSYPYGQHLDAWAGTVDWRFALAAPLEISGTFYRGRSLGGLGGGAFKDYAAYDAYTQREGLDDEGGWTQVKWKLSQVLEANAAGGEDNAFTGELRNSDYASEDNAYDNLARNLTVYGNLIYRPDTWLLFSGEYRQIRSSPISGSANVNHIVGFAAGYLF